MRSGRAAILLEIMLALALFVTTSLMLLSILSQSTAGLTRSRDRLIASDHARSAMARIEAGLARPETLNGPIDPSESGSPALPDESFIGVDPDDAPGGLAAIGRPPVWALEIETEQTEFRGITLVRVRAHQIDESGSEPDGAVSYTLAQFVRLARDSGDAPGMEGPGTVGAGRFGIDPFARGVTGGDP